LLEKSSDFSKVTRIKTSNALWKRSAKRVLRRSRRKTLSLVAGDVTGGGGKATRTKT
jgi:hypothetical protein